MMRRLPKRLLTSCFIVTLLTSFALATTAGAQSLALAPAEVRASVKGGEPVRFDLTVSNEGSTPVVMRASVTDFWYNADNEKVFAAPGTAPRSASDWVEFVPRDFTVPAMGSGKVSVVITPPPDASGGYYAVVFVESKPELAQAASGEQRAIYTNMRLGALVMLSAAGTETYAIGVDEPQFTLPGSHEPLTLAYRVTNKGNTHIFPQTKLAILSAGSRKLVARTEGEPKRLLPDQAGTVSLTWDGTLPPGPYLAILSVVYSDKIETREVPFFVAGSAARAAEGSRKQ